MPVGLLLYYLINYFLPIMTVGLWISCYVTVVDNGLQNGKIKSFTESLKVSFSRCYKFYISLAFYLIAVFKILSFSRRSFIERMFYYNSNFSPLWAPGYFLLECFFFGFLYCLFYWLHKSKSNH